MVFISRCLPSWFSNWSAQRSHSTFFSWTDWFAHFYAVTLEMHSKFSFQGKDWNFITLAQSCGASQMQ